MNILKEINNVEIISLVLLATSYAVHNLKFMCFPFNTERFTFLITSLDILISLSQSEV